MQSSDSWLFCAHMQVTLTGKLYIGFSSLGVHERCGLTPGLCAVTGVNRTSSLRATRSGRATLGLEAPRVNSLARQAPLLSSAGAIEQITQHGQRLGGSGAPHAEPSRTILSVAAKCESTVRTPPTVDPLSALFSIPV